MKANEYIHNTMQHATSAQSVGHTLSIPRKRYATSQVLPRCSDGKARQGGHAMLRQRCVGPTCDGTHPRATVPRPLRLVRRRSRRSILHAGCHWRCGPPPNTRLSPTLRGAHRSRTIGTPCTMARYANACVKNSNTDADLDAGCESGRDQHDMHKHPTSFKAKLPCLLDPRHPGERRTQSTSK